MTEATGPRLKPERVSDERLAEILEVGRVTYGWESSLAEDLRDCRTALREMERQRDEARREWRDSDKQFIKVLDEREAAERRVEELEQKNAELTKRLDTEAASFKHTVRLLETTEGKLVEFDKGWVGAETRCAIAEALVDQCEKALEDVLAHRSEDRDGNHVMWVGEACFVICDAALASIREMRERDGAAGEEVAAKGHHSEGSHPTEEPSDSPSRGPAPSPAPHPASSGERADLVRHPAKEEMAGRLARAWWGRGEEGDGAGVYRSVFKAMNAHERTSWLRAAKAAIEAAAAAYETLRRNTSDEFAERVRRACHEVASPTEEAR